VLAAEEERWAAEQRHVLDVEFIQEHTSGFEAFAQKVNATSWEEIEGESGLSRRDIEEAGRVYVEAEKVIGVYGMGLPNMCMASRTSLP